MVAFWGRHGRQASLTSRPCPAATGIATARTDISSDHSPGPSPLSLSLSLSDVSAATQWGTLGVPGYRCRGGCQTYSPTFRRRLRGGKQAGSLLVTRDDDDVHDSLLEARLTEGRRLAIRGQPVIPFLLKHVLADFLRLR